MSTTPDRLPTRPLRNWLLAWHIHTGDSPEMIAKGFDLPIELVADLLSGRAPLMMNVKEGLNVCQYLRVAPSLLWPKNLPCQDQLEVDCPWAEIPGWIRDGVAGA